MDQADKRKKNLYIAGGIIFLVACVIIVIYYIALNISRAGKIATSVQYAPYTANVALDGQPLKNHAINYITPGTYEVVVSINDFNTLTTNVTIDENSTIIYGMLVPNTERGEQIMKERQKDFLEVQSIYSAASVEEGNKERESWPILKYLPMNTILYSIGYILDDNHLTVTINTTEPYLDATIQKLKSVDQSSKTLAEYDIQISGFTNPFAKTFIKNTNTDPKTYLKEGLGSTLQYNIGAEYRKDNYFYTTITTGSASDYTLVTYRAVLRQSGNSWEIMGTPYPILTTTNTPNVPLDILNAANNL